MEDLSGSVVNDAVARIGYYNCFVKITGRVKWAQHTFCSVEKSGDVVWFDCYGGHGKERKGYVYPAEFRTTSLLRKNSETGKKEVDMNLALARGICCGNPYDIRTVYNHTSGGERSPWRRHGDCSGLVYGLTGVCHQMCSRIMMASGQGTSSLIDRPSSFEISRLFYGNWGGGRAAKKLVQRVEKMMRFDKQSEIEGSRSLLENQFFEDLNFHLGGAYGVENRRAALGVMVMSHVSSESDLTIEELVDLDQITQRIKEDVDRQLLGGSIRNDEYAGAVNGAIDRFVMSVMERLGVDEFVRIFGFDPVVEGATEVIVPDHMPAQDSYAWLGKELKRRSL